MEFSFLLLPNYCDHLLATWPCSQGCILMWDRPLTLFCFIKTVEWKWWSMEGTELRLTFHIIHKFICVYTRVGEKEKDKDKKAKVVTTTHKLFFLSCKLFMIWGIEFVTSPSFTFLSLIIALDIASKPSENEFGKMPCKNSTFIVKVQQTLNSFVMSTIVGNKNWTKA